MKNNLRRGLAALAVTGLLLNSTQWLIAQNSAKNDKDKDEDVVILSPFEVSAGSDVGYSASSSLAGARMGATVGGAKDANYVRDNVDRGQFPHPDTITAEGLFSEYDLPPASPGDEEP